MYRSAMRGVRIRGLGMGIVIKRVMLVVVILIGRIVGMRRVEGRGEIKGGRRRRVRRGEKWLGFFQ